MACLIHEKSLENLSIKRNICFSWSKERILCGCIAECVYACMCIGLCTWTAEELHLWFTGHKCLHLLTLTFVSVFPQDRTKACPGSDLNSGLGGDQAHEGWALDLPPGCRPATAEYEAETRGTGAQYCTEYGFPSEGRKEWVWGVGWGQRRPRWVCPSIHKH